MTADFQQFKIDFRDYILNDATVASLIETRFRGAQIATLFSPDVRIAFPLACFWPDVGDPIGAGRVQRFPINIRAYSSQHYDECYEVYGAIRKLLDQKIITPRIVVRALTTPTESFEEKPRLYGVGSKFLFHWVPA